MQGEKHGLAEKGRKEDITAPCLAQKGVGAWHLSPLFQLITVNPQLAHPSPLSYMRPAYPLCCFVALLCLYSLEMAVVRDTKQV